MNIYFAGLGGVGIGPLAEIALDAGYGVAGSDASDSLMADHLKGRGVQISLDQSGVFLREQHTHQSIDWYVHTAAMSEDHPELKTARSLGLRVSKRDELLAEIIRERNLKLIAIAGTHGKTTVTGMMVWTMRQLGIPISYSVGTTLSFGSSGRYDPASEYFIYECDEFDRNFLHFSPYLSLITSIDYDHPDTYPTKQEYLDAFAQFIDKSHQVIAWQKDVSTMVARNGIWQLRDDETMNFVLAGLHNRMNATLCYKACEYLQLPIQGLSEIIDRFPGIDRRFEKLADNLYSDYGHHPVEIAATLQLARELSDHVVLVYQPHQNVRQHEIRDLYTDCMTLADTIYWLPTYLSREDPLLPVLTPEELSQQLTNRDVVRYADLDDALWQSIQNELSTNHLVVCMGAGSIDNWLRKQLTKK